MIRIKKFTYRVRPNHLNQPKNVKQLTMLIALQRAFFSHFALSPIPYFSLPISFTPKTDEKIRRILKSLNRRLLLFI